MSQYSEMMGSFIRTGNYPMEANYVFPTEAILKEFYSDPLNATTIHKGLLKVVENGGNDKQALYWITEKDNKLVFTKLVEDLNADSLNELSDKLKQELGLLWGVEDKSSIPTDLNSIFDLAEAVTNLKEQYANYDSELKATVGTDGDIIEYLKTLPYQSLTEIANTLNNFLTAVDSSDTKINTLPELQAFLEGYDDTKKLATVLSELRLDLMGSPMPSDEFRTLRGIEDFVRKMVNVEDNLQSELDQTQIGVGLSGDGSYNADQETYYLKEATSVMNALKILDSLINSAVNGVAVNISKNEHNILEKADDGLLVSGTADKITYKDENLSTVLDSILESINTSWIDVNE